MSLYAIVEVNCAPTGSESYPVPTTMRIARIFADGAEAAREFPEDKLIEPDAEYRGQDVYYVLWRMDEPLNLDRCIVKENTISNTGMWLPASERIFSNTTDLTTVKVAAPDRVKQRAQKKAAALKQAGARNTIGGEAAAAIADVHDPLHASRGIHSARGAAAIPGARYGRAGSGTPWNQF